MATQTGDKVKLETMAITKSIPRATRREEFAVLVRVTAEPGPVCVRADGVDLVAVLDVSGSMSEENRLERMKQAIVFIIRNLGPDDRLSIVSFNEQVQRRTELSVMSEENRNVAIAEVDKLTAAPAGGGANTSVATEEAARILAERGEDEGNNRVGRIIFLSYRDDDEDSDAPADPVEKQDDSNSHAPELATEAFGLGADDSLSALSYGAGKTSGAYTYGKQDMDKIQDAHTGGVLSVDAGMGVQIDLQAHEGVAISAIRSGGHRVSVGTGIKGSVTIYVHDLYPGDHKSFIVYLTVPEGEEELLLIVSGLYRDLDNGNNGEDILIDASEVSVLRPDEAGAPDDETICPEVAAELDRARRLVKSAMEAKANPMPMEKTVQDEEGVGVKETIPDDDMAEDVPNPLEMPVPAMRLENVTNQAERNQVGKLGTKVEIIWVTSNPCHGYSVVAALLLLLGAGMFLISKTQEHGKVRRTGLVDVSQHPGWPKMEESLGLAMAKKMEEDAATSSFLHSASVEDISGTINKYIHQALVHASGDSLLRQTVEALAGEKDQLRSVLEARTEEIATLKTATAAACKEKNEAAVERANTRIVELERQLQDKKAFVDSLVSELANTDEHLKTCGEKVDMMETKVREMEGW